MKKWIFILVLSISIAVPVLADDLYKVTLHNNRDADILRSINADIVMPVSDGYLVLADADQSGMLLQSSLDIELLASGLRREQLAIDGRFDRKNADRFEVLYEEGRLRLLLAGPDRLALEDEPAQVFPVPFKHIKVKYREPSGRPLPELTSAALEDIQTLIDRVEQDSLEAYVLRLEAFYRRVTCTDSNTAARDYIASKFTEFGYDPVVFDPFQTVGGEPPIQLCYGNNVIATKVGSVFPEQQIIIGGHFDAVSVSPGADDNASGTAAVLECARVLQDIDTRMTFIFIAFDGEELGLVGSVHYVDGAVERNDDIVVMVNADMIGYWDNSDSASLYTGPETAYALLWDQLGGEYAGLDAALSYSGASDHVPFDFAGYDVLYVQEYYFSTVYHRPIDSSTYMNFEYMTRLVQVTLATVYTTDLYPPPIRITSVAETGDIQQLRVDWQGVNPDAISYYRLSYYPVPEPDNIISIDLPPTQSSITVEGLNVGEEYAFYVQAFDDQDQTSLAFDRAYGIPGSSAPAPESFYLSQNYPNPFNPFTRILYTVPAAAHVEISIYNVLGQKIATVVDEVKSAGTYSVRWYGLDDSGGSVASGIYLYQMKAGGVTQSKKMLLIK